MRRGERRTVVFISSRSYLTGLWRRRSKSKVASTLISLPAARRCALVHFSFRGLSFALNARWHLERQKQKTLQSLRTNLMPFPGYVGPEQTCGRQAREGGEAHARPHASTRAGRASGGPHVARLDPHRERLQPEVPSTKRVDVPTPTSEVTLRPLHITRGAHMQPDLRR